MACLCDRVNIDIGPVPYLGTAMGAWHRLLRREGSLHRDLPSSGTGCAFWLT